MGACHGGMRHWLDRGDGINLWVCAMDVCSMGWIRAIGLIYGDVSWGCMTGSVWWDWLVGLRHGGARHWLDQGDGIDSWGHAALAGSGRRDWLISARHGAMRHWLDRGNGIYSWRHTLGARDFGWIVAMGLIDGAHDTGWTGAMCLIYGGARHWLEWGNGIDLWGRVMRACDWIGEMGLICGGMPWGCDTGWMWGDGIELWGRAMGASDWIGVMELICGGEPWGRKTLTRSRRWDWFMWTHNGGTQH